MTNEPNPRLVVTYTYYILVSYSVLHQRHALTSDFLDDR